MWRCMAGMTIRLARVSPPTRMGWKRGSFMALGTVCRGPAVIPAVRERGRRPRARPLRELGLERVPLRLESLVCEPALRLQEAGGVVPGEAADPAEEHRELVPLGGVEGGAL